MSLKTFLLISGLAFSYSSYSMCLMIHKPMKVEKITCEGPITKYEDGYLVHTGKRVQIKVETGTRSSCYKSFVGAKVSVFKKMVVTETIFDEGSFPESGESKVTKNVEGKYASSLSMDGFRPTLGTEAKMGSSRDLTVVGSFRGNHVANMDYLTHSYKGTNGERVYHPNFRMASLECLNEY